MIPVVSHSCVSGSRLYASALRVLEEVDPSIIADELELSLSTKDPEHRENSRAHQASLRQRKLKELLIARLRVLSAHNKTAEKAAGAGARSFGGPDAAFNLFMSKTLTVCSHYPFFDSFKLFLLQLYRVSLSRSPVPIERLIQNFILEVPLPPRGHAEIRLVVPEKTHLLRRAPGNQLHSLDFSLRPLFTLLSPENILAVTILLYR